MPDIIENKDVDVAATAGADAERKAAGIATAARFDATILNDPELRGRLSAIARADADEKKADEKPVIEDKVADEDEDEEDGGEGGGKVLEAITKLTNIVGSLAERMDAIENEKMDEELGEEDGAPRRVAADALRGRRRDAWRRANRQAADSTRYHEGPDFTAGAEHLFAEAQGRADAVYSAFGSAAPRPLQGEALTAYRRRLLRPLLAHSPVYKGIDLGTVAIDSDVFARIEGEVFKHAADASKNPLVPVGHLTMRETVRDGHTHRTFHGSPSQWMNRFAPTGKAVVKINVRPPHAPVAW